MQIGCSAPTSGPLIGPDSLVRIATEAEMLGFDYITVSDHVMMPKSVVSRYPYSRASSPAPVRRSWNSSPPRRLLPPRRRSCASSPR